MSLKIPIPKRKLQPINRQPSENQNLNNIVQVENSSQKNNAGIDNKINFQITDLQGDNAIPEQANQEDDEQIRRKRREELQRLIEQEELEKQHKEHFSDLPEFLRRGDNEQAIISFMRMRQRNFSDGAFDFTVESDDIENENIELYENKCINLEAPDVAEDKDKQPKYYIESLSRDKFFEVKKDQELGKEESKLMEQDTIEEVKDEKLLDFEAYEKKQDDLFEEEISKTMVKIANNISIVFLFAQGLLAGISLVNIMILFQYKYFNTFIIVYSQSVELIYNFTHCLTFGSIVGNGIKLITTHRFYDKLSDDFYFNSSKKSRIKRKLIILHIAFWLFIAAFIIELVMAQYIPKIVYSYYTQNSNVLISEVNFNKFKDLYLVVDIIVILNFIINIFDVSKVSDLEYEANNS